MANTPSEAVQSLRTEAVVNVYKFDFSPVGVNSQVYLATGFETSVSNNQPWNYRGLDIFGTEVGGFRIDQTAGDWFDGATHHYIGIKGEGFTNDLTGQVSNPRLTMPAYDLWKIPEWAAATAGLNISDYRGVIVFRQRVFYNTPTPIVPQRYFIQGVDTFDTSTLKLTLTPTLGNENLNQPSARTLEI